MLLMAMASDSQRQTLPEQRQFYVETEGLEIDDTCVDYASPAAAPPLHFEDLVTLPAAPNRSTHCARLTCEGRYHQVST